MATLGDLRMEVYVKLEGEDGQPVHVGTGRIPVRVVRDQGGHLNVALDYVTFWRNAAEAFTETEVERVSGE